MIEHDCHFTLVATRKAGTSRTKRDRLGICRGLASRRCQLLLPHCILTIVIASYSGMVPRCPPEFAS
jgi:hypothetical protein